MDWYRLADIFFITFHTALILFNTLGWIIPRWRKWNLATLLLTGFSWFFLGIWYGWGYCFCTDWHWQVRQKLGHTDDPNSYVKFLIDKLSGLDIDAGLVDTMTGVLFGVSLIISLALNIRDMKNRNSRY